MGEEKGKFRQVTSIFWTMAKGLVSAAFILAGAYFLAQNLHNGHLSFGGDNSSTEAPLTTEQPNLRIEYDKSPYCPSAGCFSNHVLSVLNTGLTPIHIRGVLLNNRTNNADCELPVNRTLATGDKWEATTRGLFSKNPEDHCGTVVVVTIQTDKGDFDYQIGRK